MRIGLLTQYYKPEMGAPQNRLYEMMTGLKQCGNDVCIVTGMPNYPTGKIFPEYKGKFSCTETLDDIEVKRYWLYASNAKKVIPRIWNMVSFAVMSFFSVFYLRKKKLDYLIVETPPLMLAFSGAILSKLIGAKYIANVSDIWPLSAKELGAISEGKLYSFLEYLEHKSYHTAHICMGQSEEIVQHIRENGAKKTYLFRNGVDPRRFQYNDEEKEVGEKTIIVYAGLLGFAQGILDICKQVDFGALNAEFHIYGNGGELKDIEQFIADNPERSVCYKGMVSRQEIPNVLQQADVTLIPLVKYLKGAVPSKIYESMAAGVPILFYGEGEGARIVERYDLGWVIPRNSVDAKEALSKAIASATADKDSYERKAKNCLDCANNLFNRPKQVSELNKFLEENL